MYFRLAAFGTVLGAGKAQARRVGLCAASCRVPPRARESSGTAVLERYGMTETLLTVSNPVAR